MPYSVALLILAVAAAPWLVLAFMFARALPLLSTFLAYLQANRVVGGEPAVLLERKLAMQEADAAARRDLDLKTFELQAKELEAGLAPRAARERERDNFDPPLIPRPFIIDPTGPLPPE